MLRHLLIALFVLPFALPVVAEPETRPLRVGVRDSAPFSYRGEDGTWRGIAVETWEEIARTHGWTFTYHTFPLPELLSAIEEGRVDVGVAGLSITAGREKVMDFSHSFFEGGVAIATRQKSAGWLALTRNLLSPDFAKVVLALLAVLLGFGTLLWFLERHRNPRHFRSSWREGMEDGLWWSAVTMTTVGYGDKVPVTRAGKLVALVWMFSAIVLISSFTAAFAHALTVGAMESRVHGVEDLPRVRVVTVEGSTSAALLQQRGIRHQTGRSVPEMLDQLEAGLVDAVVFDQPVLRYHLRDRDRQDLVVLPASLSTEFYGLALPRGSALREPVNLALLDFIHRDTFRGVRFRYLGE
jgi:polar amino acid transport system substrate-binding protein